MHLCGSVCRGWETRKRPVRLESRGSKGGVIIAYVVNVQVRNTGIRKVQMQMGTRRLGELRVEESTKTKHENATRDPATAHAD